MAGRFRDIIDIYDGSAHPDPAKMPDIFYHYTSASGLFGMLSSNSIWLTDHRFLNDKMEIDHTGSILKEVTSSFSNKSTSKLATNLIDRICSSGGVRDSYDTFIFSLSEEADSLSQWRGYAFEGQGFTIGFSANSLIEQKSKVGGSDIFKVEYDKSLQERILHKSLSAIITRLELEHKKLPAGNAIEVEKLMDDAFNAFQVINFARSVSNKHSSFVGEREWRMAIFEKRDDPDDLQEIRVRVRGAELVPYVEAKPYDEFGEFAGRMPIVRIGIGPGFPRGNQLSAVQALCRRYGYDPDIYFADTPYTRL